MGIVGLGGEACLCAMIVRINRVCVCRDVDCVRVVDELCV